MSGPAETLALVAWGTAVGLDLVAFPQAMIARPLVAGAVAGLLAGDAAIGLAVGVLFELLQYEVLPVGAARYPEYGPATVAAVAAAQGNPWPAGLALGALVGLATSLAGGASLGVVRRLNTAAVHAAAQRLELGDAGVLVRVHAAGLARELVRAAGVTLLGLGLAALARRAGGAALDEPAAVLVAAVAAGVAGAAAVSGTLRVVGRGAEMRWLAAGLAGGGLLVWLR